MFTTSTVIAGKEYSLRYTIKQQKDIKENAPKKLLGHIKNLRFNSPMNILAYLDDTDVQAYLLKKGLEWEGSGAGKLSDDEAAQLVQDYLEEGEPDAGEKLESFQQLLAEALSKNCVGASSKKLQEKGKATKTEDQMRKVEELATIYEAQKLANERYQARGKNGTTMPEELPSES
jgi:polyhydroxyalkanoate synthesis regulator phasin